jgi:hypothetical protein
MVTKMLLVVLALAGQMPVRVCTCAAATRPAPELLRTTEQPPPVKGCGCGRHKEQARHPTGAPNRSPVHADQTPAGGDRHRPDCPAVNPRPVLKAALPVAVETVAADATPAPLSVPTPAPAIVPTAPIKHPPGPPPVPLFISLLVLRN